MLGPPKPRLTNKPEIRLRVQAVAGLLLKGENEMASANAPIVLVIEDYSDSRALMAALLRANGYRVIEASNGREGFAQANRVNPDLILMDLAMPELDGVEATRLIRQRHGLAQTPIFAITGYGTKEVKDDAMAAGCTEVFVKPVDLDSLMGKIRDRLVRPMSKAKVAG